MKIKETIYGFIIVSVLLGGLFITNIAGLWQASPKEAGERRDHEGRHHVTAVD